MYLDIVHCGLTRWTTVWGDPLAPSLWVMTPFVMAAILSAFVASQTTARERQFWLVVACTAALFAANVHLDLHVLPNAIGRCAAAAQGWYDQRETVRSIFIASSLLLTFLFAVAVIWLFWRQILANIAVFLGLVLTALEQAAKGVGWKGFDAVDRIVWGPLHAFDALDIAGAGMVIIGACLVLARRRAGR